MRSCQAIILVLLCCSVFAQGNNCPSFFDGDLLQSGKNTFMRSRSSSATYSYEFPVSFRVPNAGFQVATSVSTIADYDPSFGGFNFLVNGRRRANSNFVIFSLIANPVNAWTSIQISFLISARNDFSVANYEFSSNNFLRGASANTFDLISTVNKNLPSGNYRVAAFVSGFSTTDNQFQVSINQRSFDIISRRFNITIFTDSNPLLVSIALSIIIYPENHPVFEISYGSPAGDTGAYQISGPTSFASSTNIQYNEFRIANRYLACTGNQCQSSCIIKQRCVQLGGNVYEGQCRFCAPGIIFQFGFCTRRCGANQVYLNRVCVCQNGFTRIGNDCVRNGVVTCGTNQINVNGNCRQCPAGSTADARLNTCVCSGGQTYNLDSNTCSSRCGFGQIVDPNSGRCWCISQFGRYNGVCRQCPSGATSNNRQQCICPNGFIYNQVNNVCLASNPCRTSQIWRNGRCECINGYIRYTDGTCRACPGSSTPSNDGTTCICNSPTAIYVYNSNLCIQCGANSVPNAAKTACQCANGFVLQGNSCVPVIRCQFNEDLVNGQCQCKFGWIRVGPSCVQACGLNQIYDGNNCFCKQGFAKINGVCQSCRGGTIPNPAKTACLCSDPLQYYDNTRGGCFNCPSFSTPNSDDTDCVCRPGYQKQNGQCVSLCPAQSTPNEVGTCICANGKVLVGNQCVTPVSCPDRSTFNQITKICVCNNRNENIIDGVCRLCEENSSWNRDRCVCNTGFFRIGGACRTCDPRTRYNGTDCVCNLGFFGNRDLCTPCHPSCSQCSGPQANKCLSCSDVTLVLQNGFCTKNSPCNFGFFLDNGQCTKCLDNCIDCQSVFECKTCAFGYKTLTQSVNGQTIVSCDQICGDGIKYQQQCDDRNTNNGDGCNSKCQQEPGWFCSGGSSRQASICERFIPDQIQLSSKGAVNLGNKVQISVRASYLPSCITRNECGTCFKAILANVVDVKVPVLVTVSFIPLSQWQFIITVDFQGLIVTSAFKIVIRLNPQFKGCFADDDYNQQLELTVDPAFLAKIDAVETLSFDPNAVPREAFRILGI